MRKLYALVAFAAMTIGLTVAPAPAQAITVGNWVYNSATGATYIRALDRTVSSDLTSQSAISGFESSSQTRDLAFIDANSLLKAGAVQTKTSAVANGGSLDVRNYARVAGVNLLGGLVTIDAVETDITTSGRGDGTVTATGGTKFLGIKILGLDLPVNIPRNFGATIPGVATVSANVLVSGGDAQGGYASQGWALGIQLLSARDGFAAGTTIMLNPYFTGIVAATPVPAGKRVAGEAFSTQIKAKAGDVLKVSSDPTAHIGTPTFGSDGKTLTNTTATVDVPGVATIGALTSTSTSTTSSSGGPISVVNTNQTARLNLLSGLITADAIKVTASGKVTSGVYSGDLKFTFVNLTIAGRKIPVNIAPNTAIDIAGLGKVEINKQEKFTAGQMNKITGLKITLDTSKAGLPVGATIEVAVASTVIEK